MGTGAKIAIGVAAAAALYLLFFSGSSSASTTPGADPASSSSSCGSISSFIGGHVARKNAIAPAVISKYGVPGSLATKIADVAGKLDLSARLENAVSAPIASALCHVSVKQAVTSTIKAAGNPAATVAAQLPGSKYTTAVLDPGAALSKSGHGTAGAVVSVLTNPVGAISHLF